METKLDLKQYDLATIQVAAISVVGYLIFEGKDEKIAPKFVKKIVKAMKDHSDDGELQIRACDALFELSQVPTTYTVLKEKHTQELLLRAKNHFKPCESDVDDIIASCKKPRSSSRKIIVTTSECSRKTAMILLLRLRYLKALHRTGSGILVHPYLRARRVESRRKLIIRENRPEAHHEMDHRRQSLHSR